MDDRKGLKDEVQSLSKVEKSTKARGRKPGSEKTGGRKAGTVNKKTLWLREELDSVGLSWGKEFKRALDANDYQKAEILTNLLPYLNPKLKEKEIEDESEVLKDSSAPTDILKAIK